MKSREVAATLLLLAFVVVQASTIPSTISDQATTEALKTKEEVEKNYTHPKIEKEKILLEAKIAGKFVPKTPDFIPPFTNPKDMLMQEIRSLDKDAVTTKIQEDFIAKAIKAEAQRSRDRPRTKTSTQKPRIRPTAFTDTPNALDAFDTRKSIAKGKLNDDEGLNETKKELSYDEVDNVDGDDDEDEDEDEEDEDYDEDDEDEEEDDGENNDDEDRLANANKDDIADEEELMTECPDYCRCFDQYAATTTARCSKLTERQNFGPGIAHLRIENAGEINLGPQALHSRGLQQLESITIVDTRLVRLDNSAFNGTNYLFAVNLTRNALRELEADYFVNNKQLSLLKISGQSFGRNWYMSRDYLFDSPSITELDLSDNSIVRLPRAAFAKMPNLAFVDLKNNRLKSIDKSIFDTTDTLVELDLSGNLLNEIPEGTLAKGLQTLRIRSNGLISLGIQEAAKLTDLDVSHNRIKFITKEDLIGVGSLQKLTVASNGIKRIHQHAFTELDQLTYLDISDNKITSINEHHLRTNARLQILIMNDNPGIGKLPVFKTNVFEYDNFAIYRFECANCGLEILTEGTFDSMPALTRLNLARNRLSRLPAGLFKSMSALREIDLSDNAISTLEPKMFFGARSVSKLNLAGNPLVTLRVTPFLQMPGLSKLDVSRCQLRRIWSEARQPIKSLRFISVHGNELKRITIEELKAMPKLSGLDASNNPFVCDEEFNTAIQWLIDHGVTPTEVMTYISNYGMTSDDYAEFEGVGHWSDLARLVCNIEDDGPPSRAILRKPSKNVPAFTAPSVDNDLIRAGVDGLADLEFVHGQKLDDIWREQYQEYEDANASSKDDEDEDEEEGEEEEENVEEVDIYTTMDLTVWPIVTVFLVTVTIIIAIRLFRVISKTKGRGPVILPPLMLRQGLVDKKNCGLVYKPLQEEIATPHMPKRGSFYSSSTFHYDKIVPESV